VISECRGLIKHLLNDAREKIKLLQQKVKELEFTVTRGDELEGDVAVRHEGVEAAEEVTVERRCERSRVPTVAESVEKPSNKKYARDNKAFMEKNSDMLGFNKKGFMIFYCPESEGGSEMMMSEIGKKIRTDFETSKLGGSGFGIYGATTEPHDGLIQKSHTRTYRNIEDWNLFIGSYGLVDIVAQVCKGAEHLTGQAGSCDSDVQFLEAHLLLQNRGSECGTSFTVHQDDHDGVGSPGLTIVLCLFTEGAPTAEELSSWLPFADDGGEDILQDPQNPPQEPS
jgi:hypothetical protein